MGRICYYTSDFPFLSTTFIQREIRALRNQGLDLLLAANNRPGLRNFHWKDRDLLDETLYLKPVRPMPYLVANGKRFLVQPRAYTDALRTAFRLGTHEPGQRLKNLGWLAGSGVLAEILARRQVRHVHVHFAFGAAGLAWFLTRIANIPYSLSIHGSDVLLPEPLLETKLAGARFVVSNCRYHVDHLRTRFPLLEKQRFFIVRLGVDLNQGLWARPAPLDPAKELRILNVARLHPVKGQTRLIKALARLRDRGIVFHCRIAGSGPEQTNLEVLIRELGLTGQVTLLGPCQESEVVRQFHWAHVFVLSSLSEGTPATVIEAMAMARPVVAPRITALPEMVDHGESGWLFAPDSVSDLANRLALLAGDRGLVETMGQKGRIRAESRFDLNTNAAELIKIFQAELGIQSQDQTGQG